MKVLVLNCGSSSLKCQLIDMEKNERIMKGHYDRIGGDRSSLRFNVRGNKIVLEHPARNFEEAISKISSNKLSFLGLLNAPSHKTSFKSDVALEVKYPSSHHVVTVWRDSLALDL